MRKYSPRGFILPLALAIAALIAATVIFCAGLLRGGLATPERALAQARGQALWGLDVALAQLQSVSAADTSATANAKILGNVANENWVGVWAKGSSAPVWLVSGENPSPYVSEATALTPSLKARQVTTERGAYAYAVEDLSQKLTQKTDRTGDIPAGFGDSVQRLKQQTIMVPQVEALAAGERSAMSYGLLTNPIAGGWKTDADTQSAADETTQAIARWRDPAQVIRGRPLVWAEVALMMGVYRDGRGVPQLGFAFWADAWNPYALLLPFNDVGVPDLRMRVECPSGTAKYFNTAGALVGFERLDIAAHTAGSPVLTDLFGSMNPGEVRFITHYRVQPISQADYGDAQEVQIDIPEGDWNFIFETLDGQPIQKISGVHYLAVSRRMSYQGMLSKDLNPTTVQCVYGWKLREPIDTMLKQTDPRGGQINFNTNWYRYEADPVRAQTNFNSFSAADVYHGGQAIQMWDLPEGNLASVGALYHMPLGAAPALSLGSGPAGVANEVFDKYFFSSLPLAADKWPSWNPTPGLTLPNANLRLTGTPTFNELRASPAQKLLVQGAFNINTADVAQWMAILPHEHYPWTFRTNKPTQPVAITDGARAAWAQAIVAKLKANARPWRSLSELAAENILPADVFCRVSALLQPRGDTMIVHAYGTSGGASAALEALVQRLPTAEGGGRKFQILRLQWVTPMGQN